MKKVFNENKRCLHCSGTLVASTGFSPSIILPIKNDVIKVRLHDYDAKGKDIIFDITDIEINFCPFCGCQLRKKVDWDLCD